MIAGNGANANDGHEGVGGAIHSQPTWWNGSSYEPGTMKIVNSTFHGNYTDVKTNNGQSWSGTIAYGRWNNASTNTYLFNTIVSGSRTLRGGSDIAYGDIFYKEPNSEKSNNILECHYIESKLEKAAELNAKSRMNLDFKKGVTAFLKKQSINWEKK